MLHREYAGQVCSIARSLEVVGERWSLLIVREVFLGHHRFDAIQGNLGITRSVLSTRLGHLVEHGVLERRRYQPHPERFEYHATEKGTELFPMLGLLMAWGDRHYPEPEGPPRILVHRGCGGALDGQLTCRRCGATPPIAEIDSEPGPALRARGLAGEAAAVAPSRP